MQPGLLAKVPLARPHLGLGPALQRLSTQKPHLFDQKLLRLIGLLEIAPATINRRRHRGEPAAQGRMSPKKGQNRIVAHLCRNHPTHFLKPQKPAYSASV